MNKKKEIPYNQIPLHRELVNVEKYGKLEGDITSELAFRNQVAWKGVQNCNATPDSIRGIITWYTVLYAKTSN